ncbi:MAG: septal ring lytic transglycosylase RlpA family protein [Pseudomonadota bacterium]
MIVQPRHCWLYLLLSVIVGCSTLGGESDGPGKTIAAADVEDAVPQSVTPSKYGNPKSYVVNGVRYYVMDSSEGYVKKGNASWYGKKFHGRKTSSGEVFDMYRATAAHRSLPIPTYARVTNLANGKQIIVKINDRGPFHPDRLIDLSYGAAVKIGIARAGVGRVEVRVIDGTASTDEPASTEAVSTGLNSAGTFVQVGAFKHFVNAQEMRARAAGAGLLGVEVAKGQSAAGEKLYKVRLGPFTNPARIDGVISKLRAAGIEDFKLVEE